MRYKLEVPITARLVNNTFFRRFRTSTGAEGQPSILSEVGAVYGATLSRDTFSNRRAAQR